jgi:hypothetical protein
VSELNVLFLHDPETEKLLTPVLHTRVGVGIFVTIEVGFGTEVGGVSGGVNGAAFILYITRYPTNGKIMARVDSRYKT